MDGAGVIRAGEMSVEVPFHGRTTMMKMMQAGFIAFTRFSAGAICLLWAGGIAIPRAAAEAAPTVVMTDHGLVAMGGGAGGLAAITKPSQDVTLSCSRPGLIAKVLVKDGQAVKANQPVVQQDSREEDAMLAADKAKAFDVTSIRAQEAIRDQAKVDLARIEYARSQGGSNPFELDKAKIDVVVAEARVKIAEVELEQARLKYEQSRVLVEKMCLQSPLSGLVQKTFVQPGEAVELNTKVIRLVNLDPLWVEVLVPSAQARSLRKDAQAKVVFSDKQAATGKVILVDVVGDPASDTIIVRVEVANPELRQSGELVRVEFPGMTRGR